MPHKEYFSSIRSIILSLIFLMPVLIQSQTAHPKIEDLQNKIDQLNAMISKLESEQAKSPMNAVSPGASNHNVTGHNNLRLKVLNRRQKESRAQIDAITLEIISISNQLKDPSKRYALAKKMHQTQAIGKPGDSIGAQDSAVVQAPISARSIDLSAVKLIREGKNLDQARLFTIDQFSSEQINVFYRGLNKADRYELYDIADDIVHAEQIDLTSARRSAIYFYLFTK